MQVLEEEIAEREIAKLENRANKLQNRVDGKPDDPNRTWFQTKKERKEEAEKLKGEKKQKVTNKKLKKLAVQAPEDPREAKRMKDMEKEANMVVRQSKKSKKRQNRPRDTGERDQTHNAHIHSRNGRKTPDDGARQRTQESRAETTARHRRTIRDAERKHPEEKRPRGARRRDETENTDI